MTVRMESTQNERDLCTSPNKQLEGSISRTSSAWPLLKESVQCETRTFGMILALERVFSEHQLLLSDLLCSLRRMRSQSTSVPPWSSAAKDDFPHIKI